MVSKKIYIVRHGQTDFNKQGIVQGRGVNASLNERGRQQAEAFYQAYKGEGFTKVFTSSLVRTSESVAGFLKEGLPSQAFPGLDEISWGSSDGSVIAELPQYWEICGKWAEGEVGLKAMDGESPLDVVERQRPVIEEMKKANCEKLLVCMHGRAIRIILCELLGKDLHLMDDFGHHNLGLYVLSFDGDTFSLDVHNSIDHLKVDASLCDH